MSVKPIHCIGFVICDLYKNQASRLRQPGSSIIIMIFMSNFEADEQPLTKTHRQLNRQ